jgi:hypothetical protein
MLKIWSALQFFKVLIEAGKDKLSAGHLKLPLVSTEHHPFWLVTHCRMHPAFPD